MIIIIKNVKKKSRELKTAPQRHIDTKTISLNKVLLETKKIKKIMITDSL